ncbi:1-acyl-sn-glycerol-3-phosphate acyltransferase [Friedmanniella endophytica]|uniref:1-acyl-sn-glycerol-3-phosphate acyltransferase n=1 Tax=Microlunatus kandeliicorticis TaxID=1759536 RepID=A0A7W3ITY8_9ACTN|nr:lysophospholipid acyltransferase family protein [Microlunatus kandeliicorticis]MBA8795155.1 1-acyl-sn-glycerol-3-phosphate acyltransferase [Microlunatus kandeliicorticis]
MSAELWSRTGGAGTTAGNGNDWARSPLAGLVRRPLQALTLGPVLRSLVAVEARGADDLAETATGPAGTVGPVIIAANHASHLDTPVLLSALPGALRRRTVVAAMGGALFDSGWRRQASALLFNAALLGGGHRPGGVSADALLAEGWSLLVYPEGGRSVDGFLGRFADLAAELAIRHRLPLVPAGVRGTYAVLPKGRPWPVRSGRDHPARSRISVGFGPALRPGPGEDVRSVGDQLAAAVTRLIDEDATTWWEAQRHPRPAGESVDPPVGSWRRIWQQTQPPGKGGQRSRRRIWVR